MQSTFPTRAEATTASATASASGHDSAREVLSREESTRPMDRTTPRTEDEFLVASTPTAIASSSGAQAYAPRARFHLCRLGFLKILLVSE